MQAVEELLVLFCPCILVSEMLKKVATFQSLSMPSTCNLLQHADVIERSSVPSYDC